jgi:hypothetical protein
LDFLFIVGRRNKILAFGKINGRIDSRRIQYILRPFHGNFERK